MSEALGYELLTVRVAGQGHGMLLLAWRRLELKVSNAETKMNSSQAGRPKESERTSGERVVAMGSRALVVIAWIAVWVPISSFFPIHSRFPVPQSTVPFVFLFLLPFVSGGAVGILKFLVLPTAFFWGVLLLALRLRKVLFERSRRPRGGRR